MNHIRISERQRARIAFLAQRPRHEAETPLETRAPLSPMIYAIGGAFACPVIALALVFAGLLLLCAWPLVPFLMFSQRRAEQ